MIVAILAVAGGLGSIISDNPAPAIVGLIFGIILQEAMLYDIHKHVTHLEEHVCG